MSAVVIRAGRKPELGDVDPGRDLQPYRAVGRALAALAVPHDELENLLVTGMSAEQSQRWYLRFFVDRDGDTDS